MNMTEYVFTPDLPATLPVLGSAQRFPVGRVFCVGRNYPWPDSQGQSRQPPVFFMKPASNVIDAVGEVAYPPLTEEFVHEIELVVAIGEGGANIPEDQALAYVWGYAAGLDLTRRDVQLAAKSKGLPWEGAKVFDGAAPMTAIVPVSRGGHPEGELWLSVNGEERQRDSLDNQIWSVSEVISRISRSVALRAGDLIMTGSPAGVDALQPGDLISAGIDGIGQLEMRVGARPQPFA
ncbi:fumarylacetoacetate hydrolase family protein [Pseudomonas granadensis]|uniref:fumarylacetoacetate hydrolase family protein n=1 Tax=Pseudomonas granadensis TaxID=1421430 RepID=UPI0019D2BAFE|nr:fumarylacetoacetate hydrolase family protein [Pseudomonas granadensis]MBN6776186.1 fumarylacetoacetate hydrolase family protein [Pseudomonas granadensis]MBN6807204.1 fumarylacetoacetate hydrolase family protein [Pseudomonas granadensis]MBN6833948.1 fumarylacetoacetate hydrolase family protein [Pseudomonas granadensis]MBN6841579.1 fumarylacetoacetate hydrolase family protein [Pseudomonas granadensis]MBN6870136.1 fumarylacetoacetate hydrolase family protein [Pseudomonas granadensis]